MKVAPPLSGMTHALEALLESNVRSATVYLSPTLRVTASHTCKTGHLSNTVAITYGKPNWAGRLLAAKCKRRGVPLPLGVPQLKPWPKLRGRK
jgi:hypothetical protein